MADKKNQRRSGSGDALAGPDEETVDHDGDTGQEAAGAADLAHEPPAEEETVDYDGDKESDEQSGVAAGPDDRTELHAPSLAALSNTPSREAKRSARASAKGGQSDGPAASSGEARGASSEGVSDVDSPLRGFAARIGGFHFVKNPDGFAFAFVLSVAAAMIFPFLGRMGFFDPWESHYGEVARQMAQRDDFLYPFWKDSYFFSKPVLLFWLTGPLYKLIGAGDAVGELPALTELCGRLPMALIGMFTTACVWFAGRRLWGRRAGTLAALVLCTTPFFILISRQAITDMLYVGPMSSAICLLAVAFFDDDRERLKALKVPWWMIAFFGACLFPQLWEIGRNISLLKGATWFGSEFSTRLVVSAGLCAGATGILALLRRFGTDPLVHLAAALVAIATLGKGPHSVAFTGLPFFLYFLASGEWHLLKRIGLVTGTLLYLCIASPWFIVMALFEGKDEGHKLWYQRYVLYDLFGRLGGVHGNRGTHDYYVRYFAFGTVPWTPFAPIAALSALQKRLSPKSKRTSSERFELFCVIWAVALFAFFASTTTKFHHYIFPVVIPSALLIGRWFDELLRSKHRLQFGVAMVAFLIIGTVGRDLTVEPWQIVDLFTYHYVSYKPEYYFPDENWYRISLGIFLLLSLLMLTLGVCADIVGGLAVDDDRTSRPVALALAVLRAVLLPIQRISRGALDGVGVTKNAGFVACTLFGAFLYAMYVVHAYQPQVSQHWSHRQLLHTYWSTKEPADRLVSYQMDWKGETFYSHNTEQQIKKSAADLKKAAEAPGRLFVLVQEDRFKRIESALSSEYKPHIQVVDRSNKKWFLVLVDDPPATGAKAAAPARTEPKQVKE